MGCDCSKERLAVLETKLCDVHDDVKELKQMHKDVIHSKGFVRGLAFAVAAAWSCLIGVVAVVLNK